MNYWPKHIGPWLKATVSLTLAEEGAYGRLVDWCYGNEQPLPLNVEEVHRITRCRDRTEREITDAMVKRFFVQTDTGWRHERIERELAAAQRRGTFSGEKREAELQRRKRSNDKKSMLFKQARDAGLQVGWNMSITSIANLLGRNGIEDAKLPVQVAIQDVQDDLSGRTDDAVFSAAREPRNSTSKEVEIRDASYQVVFQDALGRDLNAGAACKRMRALGMATVNPGDPRLLELLRLGIDVEAIALAASEAIARGKGFAYALAIAKGRHEAQLRDRAEMLKWAPGLASKEA